MFCFVNEYQDFPLCMVSDIFFSFKMTGKSQRDTKPQDF